jgi:flagella basal body P-ring formation protein FlgA
MADAACCRIEVAVGQFDGRVTLAPCARTDFFVPGGTRLWGRARIGLRCVQGAKWSVLLPVEERIHGPALVAARHLAALQPIGADDVHVAEVEWTREAHGVVTDAAQLQNRVPTRPIAPGQPIPVAALRAPQAVSQGDAVKVVGTGRGFSVSTAAVALAAAQDGQTRAGAHRKGPRADRHRAHGPHSRSRLLTALAQSRDSETVTMPLLLVQPRADGRSKVQRCAAD